MSFRTTSQTRIGQNTTITSENLASARGTSGPAITNVIVTDSNFNNLDDTAVGTSNSFIKIIGTGFSANANVYINGTLNSAANVTFVNSTQLNVILPNLTSATNNTISLFNTNGSGAIYASPILASGFPSFTTSSYSSNDGSISVQLLATGDGTLSYSLKSGSSLPSGLTLSSSGLISGTYSGDSTTTFTVLVDDAQLQTFQQDITLTIAGKDPYFPYVPLLLNGDSINGTRTFNSDASTNNFLLKPNGLPGNSVQNPYQVGYYSNIVPSGTYFTAPDNSAFDFGAGNFTIEGWANFTSTSGTQNIVCRNYTNSTGFILSNVNFLANITTDWDVNISFSSGFTANTWQHFAVVRNGNVFTCYINGASVGTQTISGTIQASSGDIQIGRRNGQAGFAGYLSNLRIVKGTAVYTAPFTPPTTPLTAISGTSLLTCQANRFIDNSSNNFTITVNGSPEVAQNQPFTYTTPISYGSGYFNGSSYLQTPSNSAFNFSSTDCTIEFWYFGSASSGLAFEWGTGASGDMQIEMSSGSMTFGPSGGASKTSYPLVVNAWNHLAAVKSGSTYYLYINGTRNTTSSGTGASSSNYVNIGARSGGSVYITGYLSNIRISNTAVYTGTTLTVPTAPYTTTANTQLLTTQVNVPAQNSTFVDDSVNQFLITRNGNTTQGSFSPYGNLWSNYFPAGGKYCLTTPNSSNTSLGSGNFTIEGWVNPESFGAYYNILACKWDYPNKEWFVYFTGSAITFGLSTDGTSDSVSWSTSVTVPIGVWSHIAVTRSGSNLYTFLNGVLLSTNTITQTFYASSIVTAIGNFPNSGISDTGMRGYISNFRLVKGTALYTSSFTPSTTPLTAVSGTQLLTCQSNRFLDNSSNNFTVTPTSSNSVQRFSPFNPTATYSTSVIGGSGYFDGSGDYLLNTTQVTNQFTPTSGFTLDFWIYQKATQAIVFQVAGSSNDWNGSTGILFSCYPNYSGTFYWQFSAGGVSLNQITGTGVPTNQWCHVAIGYNGSTTRVWVNGSSLGTSGSGYNIPSYSKVSIGNNCVGSGDSNLSGYMSDVRFIKGTDIYGVVNSTITVPTAPLTPITNTQLLTNFTNAGIPDLAMQNNLETVGSAQVSTSVVKYGTGSIYFDGSSGDYLTTPPNTYGWNFGTGNFTVELWIYPIAATNRTIMADRAGSTGTANAWSLEFFNTALRVEWHTGLAIIASSNTNITLNVWSHIAVVRNSGTLTIYQNGTSVASVSDSSNYSEVNPLNIGYEPVFPSGNSNFYGYMDDIRITKGYARYAGNFTPPTSALKTK